MKFSFTKDFPGMHPFYKSVNDYICSPSGMARKKQFLIIDVPIIKNVLKYSEILWLMCTYQTMFFLHKPNYDLI